MKRFIFCFVSALLFAGTVCAQEEAVIEGSGVSDSGTNAYLVPKKDKHLRFVYIANTIDNDETTEDVPMGKLIEKVLEEYYRDAVENGNDVIFYLSNGDNPVIVKINTPDDNRDAFDAVLKNELVNRLSHEVYPGYDVPKMLELFGDDDFIDENGVLKYETVEFNFYVTEAFWDMGFNDSLLSKLYFVLDVNRIREENEYNLSFNIYLPYDAFKNKSFGVKNLGNINRETEVIIMPY